MHVRRWWVFAATAVAAIACRPSGSGPAVALSFPAWIAPGARVAAAILAARGAHHPLRIIIDSVDRAERPGAMVAWAQHLAEMSEVVGVVGPSGSRLALATAPIYNAAAIPQIVPSATNQLLRHVGPWTFMLAPDDSVEGMFLADYLVRVMHARRILLFYENDEYGQGLREMVLRGLAPGGVQALAQVAVLPSSDFELLFTAALRAGRPDVIVMAARERATGSVAALAARLLPGVPVVAGDAALVPDRLIHYAGPAVDQIHAVAFWLPDSTDPVQREFLDVFRRTVGRDPDANDAMVHDGLMLLATAIDEVGADRGAVREWLLSLGRARPPFHGVTGSITFGVDRVTRLRMARLEGGRPVPESTR